MSAALVEDVLIKELRRFMSHRPHPTIICIFIMFYHSSSEPEDRKDMHTFTSPPARPSIIWPQPIRFPSLRPHTAAIAATIQHYIVSPCPQPLLISIKLSHSFNDIIRFFRWEMDDELDGNEQKQKKICRSHEVNENGNGAGLGWIQEEKEKRQRIRSREKRAGPRNKK